MHSSLSPAKIGLTLLGSLLLGVSPTHAQITMTEGDAFGQSSFNTAGHWSDGLAPGPGKTYSTTYLIRTPSAAGDYTFAGDSLTLNAGGNVHYKGPAGYTITANMILNGGYVTNGGENPFTLAGTVHLASSSSIYGFKKYATVNSEITGDASSRLNIRSTGLNLTPDVEGGVILARANSYSGGTTVWENTALFAAADGALSTGNITLTARASLTLQSGVSHDYIADTASLILASTAHTVFLNFTGIDYIGGLSLDGGCTYLAPGTYGAVGSGADYTYSIFTGAGLLSVVPEPSSAVLLLGSFIGLATLRRRPRHA